MAITADQVFQEYLRPYQRRFIDDWSRRIIVLKSRRIGFSEAVIVKALLIALGIAYHDVYLCSTSFTNAKELLRRATFWTDILERAGFRLPIKSVRKTVIEFENGSRIMPLPAMSVRSRGGTVILDEFAFYQWDREVWKAVRPAVDTDPSMRIIIISTPFGASGMFWEIWTDPDGIHGNWSRHEVDIYRAAREGFPVDVEELEKSYPKDIWLQEFCCQFLSDINQYFGYDLIRRAQWSEDDLLDGLPGGKRYGGVDLGSRNHASVLAEGIDEPYQEAKRFWVAFAHTIKAAGESMDYTPQFSMITNILDQGEFYGVGVDGAGEGAQLAQDLTRKYGRRAITTVDSGTWQDVYATIPDMRLEMEQGLFLIPNTPKMRNAFAKIQRTETTNKKIRFSATEDVEGHADEFYASLLARYAARSTKPPLAPPPRTVIR